MRTFLCIGGSLIAFQAAAQDIQTPAPQPPSIVTNEVIVTATRQPQAALTYAGSVSSLDGDDIQSVSAVHAAELLNQVAGVNIHRGSGQEHLTAIRSPVLVGGAGAGSFLYLEDGVPLRAAGFANVNGLFEAESETAAGIEVTKGPGSVLYGSNAIHGLINVISRGPEDASYIDILGGEDGYAVAKGSAAQGANRLSFVLAHDDGFRADSGFDQQKFQLRTDRTVGRWDVTAQAAFQNLNQETAGFIEGPEVYKDDDIRFTNPNPEAFRDGKSYRAYIRAARDVGEAELVLTPYARRNELRFLRHFVPGQALEKNGHSSAGLLSTLYGPDWIVGVDAEYTDGFLYEFQDNPGVFSFIRGEHYDYDVKSVVLAGYGQKDFQLAANTTLTAGLRAEYTDYRYTNNIDSGTFGRFIRVDDRSDDFLAITPKLSVTHRLSAKKTLYATAARGARAPQTSDLYSVQLNQVPGDADIETLDSLEAGFKYRSGIKRINIAAFAMRKDNFFFRNPDGFNVTDGKTDHIGVEAEFDWPVTDWVSVGGSATFARHSYAFNDIVDDAANSIRDGDRVDTAPDTIANLRVNFTPPGRLSGGIEWRHMDEYFTDPGNTQTYPGHDVFVARASAQLTDRVKLYGRMDNVFDTKYANRADFAFGNERYFPGRPRTVFIGLNASLD